MHINQTIFTVILIAVLNFSAPLLLGQYAGGTGASEDPFLIETAEQMNAIGQHQEHWDKHFKQTAHIDLSTYTGEQFNMIGIDGNGQVTPVFIGVFDGDGYEIRNFTYSSAERGIALFQAVSWPGELKNIIMVNPVVKAPTSNGVAALVFMLTQGTISNCKVLGGTITGGYAVGGLVSTYWTATADPGAEDTKIINCHVTADIFGNEFTGGLVGMSFGRIYECSTAGNVTGNQKVGGLAAWNGNYSQWNTLLGDVRDCYSTCSVSGTLDIGGLVGLTDNQTTIARCYAAGPVTGQTRIGGLVGFNNGQVTNSFWDMDSSGLATSDGGTGKPTASMQSKRPFIWAGWDFAEVWTIEEGKDYPRLLCETKTTSEKPIADLNGDRIVDDKDLLILEQNWMKVYPVTCWKFDDISGAIVPDCAGDNDGYIHGDPIWHTQSSTDGALELDGIDDYLSTDYILNPAEGAFSIFVWIRGGLPGQVIVSQADGANWLEADSSEGKLMTFFSSSGRSGGPLHSQAVITDGLWHRVGLVWDGSYRFLYVDDIEVARDTNQLGRIVGSDGAVHLGCGKNLESGSFFSGTIDDFKIYDRVVTP